MPFKPAWIYNNEAALACRTTYQPDAFTSSAKVAAIAARKFSALNVVNIEGILNNLIFQLYAGFHYLIIDLLVVFGALYQQVDRIPTFPAYLHHLDARLDLPALFSFAYPV